MWRAGMREGVRGAVRGTMAEVARGVARRALATAAAGMRVGWIGTGVMGFHMARHAAEAGADVTVYSRTLSKAEPLRDVGATVVPTAAEAAAGADVVCLMLGYPHDVRDVVLGGGGVLAAMKDGAVLVDHTTSEPSLACAIAEAAAARGVGSIDAPVSGGDVGARNGALSIMAGGTEEDVARVQPLLDTYGANIVHTGGAGAGQHTKAANQVVIATGMIAMVEGLLYAQKAGLDLHTTLQAIGGGAAGSWSLTNYAPRIIARTFDPGFFIQHFLKDLKIALDEAARMQLSLPGLALAHQFYVAAQAQGLGDRGTHALALVLEQLNNTVIENEGSK